MTKRTCPHCNRRVPVEWEGSSISVDKTLTAIFSEHDPCPGSYMPVEEPEQHRCSGLAQPFYGDERGRCGPVDMDRVINHLSRRPMTSKVLAAMNISWAYRKSFCCTPSE